MAAVIMAATLLVSGCTRFDSPIVAARGEAMDPRLVGRWSCSVEGQVYSLDIFSSGTSGRLRLQSDDSGQAPESARLVTARLAHLDFASVRRDKNSAEEWSVVRYEVVAPDRVRVFLDDGQFWSDAVQQGTVHGAITTDANALGGVRSVTVSASREELRALVSRHGKDAFEHSRVCELARSPPN